jgi:hypothetical protein
VVQDLNLGSLRYKVLISSVVLKELTLLRLGSQ